MNAAKDGAHFNYYLILTYNNTSCYVCLYLFIIFCFNLNLENN